MEHLNLVVWLFNGVMAVALFLLKSNYTDVKETLKNHSDELNKIKMDYLKKEDFREFKEELWKRFDKLEDTIRDKK